MPLRSSGFAVEGDGDPKTPKGSDHIPASLHSPPTVAFSWLVRRRREQMLNSAVVGIRQWDFALCERLSRSGAVYLVALATVLR